MRVVLVALGALVCTQSLAAPETQRVPSRYQQLLEQTPLRPIPTFMELEEPQSAPTRMFAEGAALPIYLNRWGGTYYAGQNNSATNHSSIVGSGSATVGGFSGTDSQWSQVMGCVSDLFSAFNVHVTDFEPTSGEYVEAVVGGSPGDVDMPWGVAGVAPFDPFGCGVIPRAIVYTFSDVYDGSPRFVRDVCETTAQEIAHAFSLDHVMLCEDPMTYLSGCGQKTFQDAYATCGEYEPRECSCERPSQNSVQLLYEKLGASDGSEPPPPPNDASAPDVALLSPADEAILPSDDVVEIVATASDDVGLVLVELLWEFTDAALPCPGEGGGWTCTRSGDEHIWRVAVGEGLRSFSVRARDVAGKVVVTPPRSIWLSPDGSPPPDDELAPEVRIVSPDDGVTLPERETIDIVATAADDTGVARMDLMWDRSGEAFPCPLESRSVTCEVVGSTYIWSVRVGRGSRTFSVRAKDLLGHVTETDKRTVNLSANVPEPRDLENDTFDFASPLECGETAELDILPGQEDWFSVSSPEGQHVELLVSGDVADDVDLLATTGPHSTQTFAHGEGGGGFVIEPPAEGEAHVRLRTHVEGGSYSIEVRCFEPPAEEPPVLVDDKGCSSGGDADTSPPTAALTLLLFGFALLRRRR